MALLLGGIVMWSGNIANIPEGWALCDGANGTPDLRNRFVVGAGDTYSVGDTGGSADAVVVEHTHTGSTDTVGTHNHTTTGNSNFGGGTPGSPTRVMFYQVSRGANSSISTNNHSHTLTIGTTGSSATNANLPPYYALAFIQQIS
jgi:microcystin-dependent protein